MPVGDIERVCVGAFENSYCSPPVGRGNFRSGFSSCFRFCFNCLLEKGGAVEFLA